MTPRLYLPDTNALSRYGAGRSSALSRRVEAHATELRLSSVVWFELRYGAEKRPDIPALEIRLERLREIMPDVEPFDEEAAWHAARVRVALATLRPNAQPIGHYDTLLAGHALALGAVLVTNNVDEFARVPGLAVEDWQSP